MILPVEKDPMGRAILDFWQHGHAARLEVMSPMFDDDEIPVDTLFREYAEMPEVEKVALSKAGGKILDVGAGAGCHSLFLQSKGMDVTPIDISPNSVSVMRERGLAQAECVDFFDVTDRFDTVLMLMNGIGIVGTTDALDRFFTHLDKILAPDGQLLCDSSDISYVFQTDNGTMDFPDTGRYYGELTYKMRYRDIVGESFNWLYIDADTLREAASRNGFVVDILKEGEHYDYLARISRAEQGGDE